MEQHSSTSTVTVEYFDPHDVYKLLAPGLVPRLPLHNLHWQSHSGPLRSIDTLHVDLVPGPDAAASNSSGFLGVPPDSGNGNGFPFGSSSEAATSSVSLSLPGPGSQRRHQIPGIRATPYLKLLLVRCDDNDSYKSSVRSEIREWIKAHASPSSSSYSSSGAKKTSGQENHDAFEWFIVHVVIPNTVASTQPRTSSQHKPSDSDKQDTGKAAAATSRWRTGSTPLMEKLRTDFNGSAKGAQDRITQIRIGINDVPYSLLPRVVPAVPTGYTENEHDAETAWAELMAKLKSSILSSFDMRVTQYEEDIREKDAQRNLPGWNFCTFFMLKEGLARGFENVGLVEDALVGYDELSAGLDAVIHEQLETGSPEAHGGAMLSYTKELKLIAETGLTEMTFDGKEKEKEEEKENSFDEIPISAVKKAYRDMIMENKVSVFDFRCYIFARQMALLLRLGNAVSSREELLAKLRRQQQSILTGEAPLAPPPPSHKDEPENLAVFAEICERTLHFIPNVSQILREDIIAALTADSASLSLHDRQQQKKSKPLSPEMQDTMENMVASFAFSVAQQILAHTSTKALPIPPSTLTFGDGHQDSSGLAMSPVVESRTGTGRGTHPARNSSLYVRANVARPPPSPGIFPGPGRPAPASQTFVKPGLDELAARRAELYMLSRTILTSLGKKWGWSNGWDRAALGDGEDEMEDVSLGDQGDEDNKDGTDEAERGESGPSVRGIDCKILRTATGSEEDFYRLYEILTDKAMRHYTLAGHDHAVHSSIADLAVLKFHVKEFKTAASYFSLTAPFFGDGGWDVLELAMLAMYAQCLDEMQAKVEYVGIALKLLTKLCAAERARWLHRKDLDRPGRAGLRRRDFSSSEGQLEGVLEKLCRLAKTLAGEVRAPLEGFFANVELAGPPEYHDGEDGCSLFLDMRSLLPERLVLDAIQLRIVSVDGGPKKGRVFEIQGGGIELVPGRNRVKLTNQSVVAGRYRIEYLGLSRENFVLEFERDASVPPPPPTDTDVFRHADVVLFQRTSAFDVTLTTSRHTSLDKSNHLELTISTGWNSVRSCEVRIKPATGGLRFTTTQAAILHPPATELEFARAPEAGVLYFGRLDKETHVTLQFPYSMEQDVTEVCAKIEASYVTDSGCCFSAAKALSVPVSLALGVNVQDVFKHGALFSRFNVSTASSSPLRLYSSELLPSALFESASGVPASSAVTIFPKQSACLLFRVNRKDAPGGDGNGDGDEGFSTAAKTMYLKLRYSVLEVEVEQQIRESLYEALGATPLREYAKLVAASVLAETRNRMQPDDLERAALTGSLTTAHLLDIPWEKHFYGLGAVLNHASTTKDDACAALSAFIRTWLRSHARLAIPPSSSSPSSILIPVEIPSVSIVHTADIRIQTSTSTPSTPSPFEEENGIPTVWLNQLLTATLRLSWTRTWRTEATPAQDQEFSYEVTAPGDTWLLGGRRKGHFTIPGSGSGSASQGAGAGAEVEGAQEDIVLAMIPLREGWLAYPTVEVREVLKEAGTAEGDVGSGGNGNGNGGSEVDLRNLGETVRVVGNRRGVTVSLDASGPGGGPLTFESEGMAMERILY